jgi:nucleotide-binding universal stress UspA family protein
MRTLGHHLPEAGAFPEANGRHAKRTAVAKYPAAAMFLNILVAIDGSDSSRRALEQATDVARAMNSKLTLITVAPPLSHYVTLGGVSSETMREELDRWAKRVLNEAAAAVPDDVSAHRVQLNGHPGAKILEELERGRYDLLVVGSRGRGRAQEGLLGSVNGYLHFHSHVPLLSVPGE